MPLTLSPLADRWKDAPAAERANAQSYLIELWLRPDYQIPRFGKDLPVASGELGLAAGTGRDISKVREAAPWPVAAADQILAVKAALDGAPRSLEQVVAWFRDARPDFVERHLDTLAILGEARKLPDGRYAAATPSLSPPAWSPVSG